MQKFFTRLDHLIPTVILSFSFLFFIIHSVGRREILVIHSYQTDYSWVLDLNKGIKGILDVDRGYNVRYHYMDTKRHQEDSFLKNAGLVTRRLIEAIRPNVIICVDDNAQKLVGQYYINEKDISIVFSGVNANQNNYGYQDANNVTGILERLPLSGLRDTLYIIAKQKRTGQDAPIRAAHISDNSITVQKDDEYMKNFPDWGRVNLKESKLVSTFDEWKEAVYQANQSLDFIIVSNYQSIKKTPLEKKFMDPKELVKWTIENAMIPVVGVNTFFVEDGGGACYCDFTF